MQVAVFGQEAIFRNGEPAGYLRRGDYAFYLDKPIGMGYVTNKGSKVTKEYLQEGVYEIEVLGQKHKATLHFKSPFDPHGLRLLGNYKDQEIKTHDRNEREGGCE